MTVESLVPASTIVIASVSEAIQGNEGKNWIASSQVLLAMTLMVLGILPRSRDTLRPSFANSFAQKKRAQCDPKRDAGKTGCALHPRSHVHG
jgi:hypothetical protein